MKVKYNLYRTKKRFKRLCQDYRRSVPFVALIILIFMIYLFSILSNNTKHIYHHKEGVSFEGGRILGNPKVIYERKEQVLSKKIQKIGEEMQFLKGELKQLKDQKVKEVKSRLIERLQDGSHPEEEKSLSKGEATSQEGKGEKEGKDSLLQENGVRGDKAKQKEVRGVKGIRHAIRTKGSGKAKTKIKSKAIRALNLLVLVLWALQALLALLGLVGLLVLLVALA